MSISHPKRTLGHRSRLERFAKFCQCVSVPTGRRTVNTEPLPVSLVTVHVAAHHARELAGDGKAELGAAVSPRAQVRPPTVTSTSILSRTAARARVRSLSRVRCLVWRVSGLSDHCGPLGRLLINRQNRVG